jgi:hypothetical protein
MTVKDTSFCDGVAMRSGTGQEEAQDEIDGMRLVGTHKALVFGQKHGNAGVDFTNSQ